MKSGTAPRFVGFGVYQQGSVKVVTLDIAAGWQAGCKKERGDVHVLIRRAMPLLWPQVDRDVSDEGMLNWMLPDVQGKRILRCVHIGLALGSEAQLVAAARKLTRVLAC